MKKVLLIVLMSLLFSGVVTASSINGDYKGMPIVKITSGERVLETDEVPGFIYEGHTVVPISTLRQLGASVTWDTYSYTVDVKLPSSSSPTNNVETKELVEMFRDTQALRFFIFLYDQNTLLNNAVNTFSSADTLDQIQKSMDTADKLDVDGMNLLLSGSRKFKYIENGDFEIIVNAIKAGQSYIKQSDLNGARSQWAIAQNKLNSIHSKLNDRMTGHMGAISPQIFDKDFNFITD